MPWTHPPVFVGSGCVALRPLARPLTLVILGRAHACACVQARASAAGVCLWSSGRAAPLPPAGRRERRLSVVCAPAAAGTSPPTSSRGPRGGRAGITSGPWRQRRPWRRQRLRRGRPQRGWLEPARLLSRRRLRLVAVIASAAALAAAFAGATGCHVTAVVSLRRCFEGYCWAGTAGCAAVGALAGVASGPPALDLCCASVFFFFFGLPLLVALAAWTTGRPMAPGAAS